MFNRYSLHKIGAVFAFAICLSVCSCSKQSKQEAAAEQPETVTRAPLTRLDLLVGEFPSLSPEERDARLGAVATPMSDYLCMMGMCDGDLALSVDSLAATAAYSAFLPDVVRLMPNTDDIEASLGRVESRLHKLAPTMQNHYYFGVISPFNQQIVTVDSLVFVALNHYLGADYAAYAGMPEYVRVTKTAAHLPYDVAEAIIAIDKPYVDSDDATVLSRIIYEGALANAVVSTAGDDDDASVAEFLGWSTEDYNRMKSESEQLLMTLAQRNLLYSTDASDARRLVAPAPSTTIISPDVPGRAGRFLGYELVRKYLKDNPSVSPFDLLEPSFYGDARHQQDVLQAR